MSDLSTLLHILQNPDHPQFAMAVERLNNLVLEKMPKEELAPLLAQLDNTINTLTKQREHTSQQLELLRNSSQALKSYKANQS